jgi:putative FmdB family regulatory protein
MPTYEYRCEACDRTFDVVQSFRDEPLTACPTCGSPVRKLFGNVGIVFKGSGFYKTDSRNGAARKESKREDAKTPSGSEESKSSEGQAGSHAKSSSSEGSPAKPPAPTPSNASSPGSDNGGQKASTPAGS